MEKDRIENTDFRKLVGKWKTEGRTLSTYQTPEMKISGTDTYEIILEGFFILHTADVLMGNERSQTHEIIGWDETLGKAVLNYYNNQGVSGKMTGTLESGELSINGDGLKFKGLFSNQNKKIEGIWEKSTDQNTWVEFLKMKLTKVE